MNISEQEFNFMTEAITSDLIQMLMDDEHLALAQATETVYGSKIYEALLRPVSKLYTQSSGYVYQYLKEVLLNSRRPAVK